MVRIVAGGNLNPIQRLLSLKCVISRRVVIPRQVHVLDLRNLAKRFYVANDGPLIIQARRSWEVG